MLARVSVGLTRIPGPSFFLRGDARVLRHKSVFDDAEPHQGISPADSGAPGGFLERGYQKGNPVRWDAVGVREDPRGTPHKRGNPRRILSRVSVGSPKIRAPPFRESYARLQYVTVWVRLRDFFPLPRECRDSKGERGFRKRAPWGFRLDGGDWRKSANTCAVPRTPVGAGPA